MATHIALLRGINVGGRNRLAMSDLKDMLTKLGFSNALSVLQSGNLNFEGGRQTGAALERRLETETQKRLKTTVVYVVRTGEEWKTIVARNPFTKEARSDPSHLVVMCLKDPAVARSVKALAAAIKGPELVRADGRQLYIVYPDGIGRSKLTNAMIEKTIGTQGTARNWNTMLKLAALSK